jgi:WD40 repeat protein
VFRAFSKVFGRLSLRSRRTVQRDTTVTSKPKKALVNSNASTTLNTQTDGHAKPIRSVAFSPDGSEIISGSNDCTVRVWDTVSGAHKQTLKGHTGWIFSVAFSPDGLQIISGSADHTVRVWDAVSGAHKHTLEGHTGRIFSVAFSPDGSEIISGSDDCTVRVWDAGSASLEHIMKDFDYLNDTVDSFLARSPLTKGP